MKIGAYMQINQMYQTSKTKNNAQAGKSRGSSDKIELSSFGKELSVARQAVSEAPEVREDRVAELKSAIKSGTYDLSVDRLADKLVDKYFG
ncbi:MAG: flagellar biosynthesis anti-sigma factor FlgM [Lachnospiraceae bacterium]|nr:flagellar biosynthesis anti-sigma factor FlgM [Lachnospiraceae bacterium]